MIGVNQIRHAGMGVLLFLLGGAFSWLVARFRGGKAGAGAPPTPKDGGQDSQKMPDSRE